MAADLAAAFRAFRARANLLAVLDHSGRAGNGFVMASFDQHPQVLGCHWAHYLYSYLLSEFGDSPELDTDRAKGFILSRTKFGLTMLPMNAEQRAFVRRIGGDPDVPLDREAGLRAFTELLSAGPTISRRDLVLAAYFAFAVAAGRDVSQAAYILTSDAVSLRGEPRAKPFSGRIAREMLRDFPQARFISLVRDPRAVFASNRHQFVNVNGNMHGLAPGSLCARLAELASGEPTTEGCVFLHWIVYCTSAAKTVYALKTEFAPQFITLRNEDLNLDFAPTLRGLCRWLGVDFHRPWAEPDFAPTSLGSPWRGAGAYSNAYQTNAHGPLKNDPDSVSRRVTGPNAYVTQRWRSRLSDSETAVIEALFADEMRDMGYEPLHADPRRGLAARLWRPFTGELPAPAWLAEGARLGWRELGRRLFYALALPPFYALSRLALWRFIRRGYFDNPSFRTLPGPAGWPRAANSRSADT